MSASTASTAAAPSASESEGQKLTRSPVSVLNDITLYPVEKGAIQGDALTSQSLWENKDQPIILWIVRRPGCPLCREDAKGIIDLYRARGWDESKVLIYGVIKEVAPVKGAATDAELGVDDFHTHYFGGFPLYIDQARKFYEYFGSKSLFFQSLPSWNPFTLYQSYCDLKERLKCQNIEGNLKGEGLLKGGLLIVHRGDIVFRHDEMTGYQFPYEEIFRVLDALVASEAK